MFYLLILFILTLAQDPKLPKLPKSQYVSKITFFFDEKEIGNGILFLDSINQRIRIDWNQSLPNDPSKVVILDYVNEKIYSFQLDDEKMNKLKCKKRNSTENENPFTNNKFSNSRFQGIYWIENRVSGLFEGVYMVWPVEGFVKYWYDIFEGFPSRIEGTVTNKKVEVKYSSQRSTILNEEIFKIPNFVKCEEGLSAKF